MNCSHTHSNAHEHEHHLLDELVTLRDWLRYTITRFNRQQLFFGHGCTNAYDEAVWLLLATLSLPPEHLDVFLDACIPSEEREQLFTAIENRCEVKIPTAYLTHEIWLSGFRFYIDGRALIPRSFFGELLEDSLAPWIPDPMQITQALDLCTGSGCLAILMAHAFPSAHIVGADISSDALDVARRNVTDYDLNDRIELIETDLFSQLQERQFDLIISNPPYVTDTAMETLPAEYQHEPRLALTGGTDGLDIVRQLLAQAHNHLTPNGILAVEIGHNRHLVEQAFPDLPFTWLSTPSGEENMIFILHREDLPGMAE